MLVEDKRFAFRGTFKQWHLWDLKLTYRHVYMYNLTDSRPVCPSKASAECVAIKSVSGPYRHIYMTKKKKKV